MMNLKKVIPERIMPCRNFGGVKCGMWICLALLLIPAVVVTGCVDEKMDANQEVITQIPQETPEIVKKDVTDNDIINNVNNESIISSTNGNIQEKYSLEKLISVSDSIIIGKVISISPSRWDTPDGKKPAVAETNSNIIFTDIFIEVDKYLKNPQNTGIIIVRVLGGKVGEDEQKSEDQPSYNLNESVLIFLVNNLENRTKNIEPEHFVTLGKSQGKISISENGEVIVGNEKMPLDELRAIITGNTTKTTAVARIPI